MEKGLAVFIERYRPATPEAALLHIVRGLGYFDDVADDPGLPVTRSVIESYWAGWQPEIIASLDWVQ